MPAPTNQDDVIDSRDVIARIVELEDDLETLMERQRDLDDAIVVAAGQEQNTQSLWVQRDRVHQELKDWHDSNSQELKALQALAAEAENYAGDWQHGATLISLDYWPTYAMEMVQDKGDLPRNIPNYVVIDWEATAGNLAVDYTEVDFAGATYLVR